PVTAIRSTATTLATGGGVGKWTRGQLQSNRPKLPRTSSAGTAIPRPAPPARRPAPVRQQHRADPGGIGYLDVLGDAHDARVKDQVSYRSLIQGSQPKQQKGQDGHE